ncbi:DUF2161 family putative PD-(D/E)XK-type phosphodiesterase [Psychromonas aquatilis]|uniref:DUF2161 family putative PD-(D/E)XK-type phosphodiesterase n=1 Tax=Psychromonas aquatilis TaxID=2005072 RepID=A0ABU9GTM3_9GAMM
MHNNLKESDLYTPIKQFLTNLGYQVKGEIKSCDIVAIKDDEVIIIELKLTLNITLLLQSIDRFSLADIVYIAIPKQSAIYKKKQKQVKKLVARLGLGLMVVDIQKEHAYVEVIRDPKEYTPQKNKRKQKALLKEFHQRQGDTQKGGSTTRKAGLTAYRQRSIRIAEYMKTLSSCTGMQVNKAIQEPQATQFLYNNHYGWFNKVSRGVYALSEKGKTELVEWQQKDIVATQ